MFKYLHPMGEDRSYIPYHHICPLFGNLLGGSNHYQNLFAPVFEWNDMGISNFCHSVFLVSCGKVCRFLFTVRM